MINFTESELEIIKECVKSHPDGYQIMFSDNQYEVMKKCVHGHPKSKDIINKIEELQYHV